MMLQRQSSTGLSLSGVLIRLRGLTLIDLSADVAPGSVLTVMGPSGSGKSTLLSYIGGFLDPDFDAQGAVSVDGLDLLSLPAEARRAGILFQDPLLFPHMSVG
ncbi:MAG: ATP-binding cassette domain-containing protein, partial [Rhizobium rosettiformans]